jgi:hypothetical protein
LNLFNFIAIPKEQFDAYFYGRAPFVKAFTTELGWLMCEANDITLLAVILRCEIDKDFNAVILGRDCDKKFRAIDMVVSIETNEELIHCLNNTIEGLLNMHVNGAFPQGDEASSPFSIFKNRINEEKRNRYIKLLTDDPVYFPAKVMMEELAYWFKDPDGIFIKAMQGNEFNSRLFELYLHAAFYELDFEIDRSNAQPDYLLSKNQTVIAIEATTVAESDDNENIIKLDQSVIDDLKKHVEIEMPFKFARSLLKKVRHKPEPLKLPYWELPHVKNRPFVIAIQDYSKSMSMSFSGLSLQSYLYGCVFENGQIKKIERHYADDRTIASNFFSHPNNKNIAAVMLVTGATIPKFNRMGRIAGLRSPNSVAVISGTRTDQDGYPKPFKALVEDPSYREMWHEGIAIFHNPNAITPLDPSLFPTVIHTFFDGTNFKEHLPKNYIVSSSTQMLSVEVGNIEDVLSELIKETRPK